MHCACVHTKCRHALRMRSHELESDARFCCKSPPPPLSCLAPIRDGSEMTWRPFGKVQNVALPFVPRLCVWIPRAHARHRQDEGKMCKKKISRPRFKLHGTDLPVVHKNKSMQRLIPSLYGAFVESETGREREKTSLLIAPLGRRP